MAIYLGVLLPMPSCDSPILSTRGGYKIETLRSLWRSRVCPLPFYAKASQDAQFWNCLWQTKLARSCTQVRILPFQPNLIGSSLFAPLSLDYSRDDGRYPLPCSTSDVGVSGLSSYFDYSQHATNPCKRHDYTTLSTLCKFSLTTHKPLYKPGAVGG